MDKIHQKLLELQKLKLSKKYWNISWNQGIFISNIIKIFKPKNILELGTSNGFSTLFIAKYLEQSKSKIYSVEINFSRYQEAKNNISDCSLNNIYLYNQEILEFLENNKFDFKFDFIFLDAMQREYLNLIKILFKKKLISSKFRIICDNVLSHNNNEMNEFKSYISNNFKFIEIKLDSGFIIIYN